MALQVAVITLILLAVMSIIINRQWLPKVSINYISLFVGGLLAAIPLTNRLVGSFEPDAFIGLIVVPLLFFEGQATRMNTVGHHVRLIVGLTVGMVIVCTAVAGIGTAVLTSLSWPLAFVMAAISTPTDATATESVTTGLKLPSQEGRALKLESLFNDASGIVLLNMAVLWYVSGHIAITQTLVDFLYSSVGGVLLGLLSSLLIVYLRQQLLRSQLSLGHTTYNNGTPFLVTYLLTPFVIYYLAEAVGISGIIAVVFAGLVHNAEAERGMLINPRAMYDGYRLIELVSDILNSVVFVVLGIVLVRTLTGTIMLSQTSLLWIGIGGILYVANLLVRYGYYRWRQQATNQAAWIFALGGIHGAVTFALAYTVAASQVSQTDFNLIILSESTLIILSMVVPTVVFRWLLPKQTDNRDQIVLAQTVRRLIVEQAIEFVQSLTISQEFKDAISYDLQSQEGQTTLREFGREWRRMIRHPEYTAEQLAQSVQILCQAFQCEKTVLTRYRDEHPELGTSLFNKLYQEISMAEIVTLEVGNRE